MPQINEEKIFKALELLEEEYNLTRLTLPITKDNQKRALEESEKYFKNRNNSIYNMLPLSIYYIISKLNEDEQIEFIKTNLDFIKKNDEEIFLYDIVSPKSLSYFFSLRVLKEIKNIAPNILNKIFRSNINNLVYGFTHEDYYELYNYFFEDINKMENYDFINILYRHNRLCYDNIKNTKDDINKLIEKQKKYNKELISFVLKKYSIKISKLEKNELLSFIECIDNIEIYEKFVLENKEKINFALKNLSENELEDYLTENSRKQEILISNFFESIIKDRDINKIIYKIKYKIIINLYKTNKEIFNSMSLKDWVKLGIDKNYSFNEFIDILNDFTVINIEQLFDDNYFNRYWKNKNYIILENIENKYRNEILTDGSIVEINNNTSIFTEKYLKNLKEIKVLLKEKVITKNDSIYVNNLTNFIMYLQKKNIVVTLNTTNIKEIEKFFYKIVMGKSLTSLYKISNIEEIAAINRLGKITFEPTDFSVEQLNKYNVKHHKKLYSKISKNNYSFENYKKFTLKLMLMVGYNHAKAMLEIDNSIQTLEYLVGNVDIKNIVLDDQGNPVLNQKIMNLLFNDKKYTRIKEMLKDKTNDLYKYFPRIFNDWEAIKLCNKDNSLDQIIEFLKTNEISLSPKYYRLEGLFKYIGCNEKIVAETLSLHDEILKRKESTIPKISGYLNGYQYEILNLNDMTGLTVGNITDCCFTVLGNGYSCLKHATTSKNGRILVIKKDNKLIAHSWLWRNGDTLCIDNIETFKNISEIDFLDVYLKLADEILKKSFETESIKECIKNITIGYTNFDKKINGIENFPCLVSKSCNLKEKNFGERIGNNRRFVDDLPRPIEDVKYLDSKNVQYLIRGTGIFNFGQSNYNYFTEKESVMYYNKENSYDKIYLETLNKKINALRYIKAEREQNISSFNIIYINDLSEAYCSDDWYQIVYNDGTTEEYINSSAEKAYNELSRKKLSLQRNMIMI